LIALAAALSWPRLSRLMASPPATQPAAQRVGGKKDEPGPKKAAAPVAAKKKPGPLDRPQGSLTRSALSQFIDRAVEHQLDTDRIPASPRADDAEFLRRVYLDLTGVIPPADKAAAFLDSKDRGKRAKVIDELLAGPEFGRHLAEVYQTMLLPRNSDNRRLQAENLHRWLEEAFNSDKGWDKVVYEFLTAEGTQDKNGAVLFYVANPTPDKMTDAVTRVFLGVQLQCAQCHNHPFTSWKQDEYWAMAAFFSKVRANGRAKNAAKKGINLGVSETARGKGRRLPPSAKVVPAKFLQGDRPELDKNAPYRPVLARWVTSPKNPFFARAMVNRMWGHFFGRGFVNPVDDMHDKNTPSHPVLLEVLAEQFARDNFNLKNLVRAVCNSETYQRTSRPVAGNENDDNCFSHMAVKVLSPEQLYDSLVRVVGAPANARAAARGKKVNPKRGPVGARAQFIAFFRTEDGAEPTEYQAGIPQALRLMNSPQLSNGAALLNRVVKEAGASADKVIERLFLATLSRRPTAPERRKMAAYVARQDGPPRKAYGDILWVLLNTSEFALNH
jgi:hypothetical protein